MDQIKKNVSQLEDSGEFLPVLLTLLPLPLVVWFVRFIILFIGD